MREIHGQKVKPRPPLGANPFAATFVSAAPLVSFGPERYASAALNGTVRFDYSDNDGRFVLGAGDMMFETKWEGASNAAIHVYRDPPSIRSVALAAGVKDIADIKDASAFNTSSRVRTPCVGEIVVWQNTAGYFLATKIESVASRSHGATEAEIVFSYAIQPNRTASFDDPGRQS